MEFNRNHYFMLGLVVLALGIQFRFVDSYVLNEQATQVAAKVLKPSAENGGIPAFMSPVAPRQVRPGRDRKITSRFDLHY